MRARTFTFLRFYLYSSQTKPACSSFLPSPDPFLANKVDYVADSNEMLKQIREAAMETNDKADNSVKPDPNCNIKDMA